MILTTFGLLFCFGMTRCQNWTKSHCDMNRLADCLLHGYSDEKICFKQKYLVIAEKPVHKGAHFIGFHVLYAMMNYVQAYISNQHLKIPGQLGRKKFGQVLLKIISPPYSCHQTFAPFSHRQQFFRLKLTLKLPHTRTIQQISQTHRHLNRFNNGRIICKIFN